MKTKRIASLGTIGLLLPLVSLRGAEETPVGVAHVGEGAVMQGPLPAKLWRTLVTDFGPQRKQTRAHPEIHPANAFVGNQLRLELLSRHGRSQQMLDEAIGYWRSMAECTGTLWEHDTPGASCNHGFASHAAHVLLRDVRGLHSVDRVGKSLRLRFGRLELESCEGAVPTPDGPIEVPWVRMPNKLLSHLEAPSQYQITLEDLTGLELQKVERREFRASP